MGGATCAESPVPSVASEELAVAKRWTSLALVMQVENILLTKSFTETSLADLPHLLGGRVGDGCCGACPQHCSVLACIHTGAEGMYEKNRLFRLNQSFSLAYIS